jgi:hypothetical protein
MTTTPTIRTNPAIEQPIGRDVLEEAAALLSRLRFGESGGACARGEHLAIHVSPEREQRGQALTAHVTCHAFCNRTVDWDQLPVWALRTETGQLASIGLFNPQGHAVLRGLAPDEHTLESALLHGRSGKPVALPGPTEDRAYAHAARSPEHKLFSAFLDSVVIESSDGRVRATVWSAHGETVVAFESKDPALAGTLIRFGFVPRSGRVKYRGSVSLEPDAIQRGLWVGRWVGKLIVEEPCELVFAAGGARQRADRTSSEDGEQSNAEGTHETGSAGPSLAERANARTKAAVVGVHR